MNTKVAVTERAQVLVESGLDKKKVIATLVLEDYSAKEISEAFPAGERKSFRADFYDFVVENIPTNEEAEKWIREYDGVTNNQINHIPTFLKEATLARRVAESLAQTEE